MGEVMTFRTILLIAPAACLVAVGNFAHADPATQTTAFLADQHRAVGPQSRFVVVVTAPEPKQDVTALTSAMTEAVPTHGLFLGRTAVPQRAVDAVRRATVPSDTLAQRMAGLDK
jgi:hypothetical protein